MLNRNKFKRNIATFFLVLMCVQYIPLEGDKISYIKFTAMCFTPAIFLFTSPKISKGFVLAGLYFMVILFSSLYNIETFRLSTIGYLLSFIFTFIMYYNLVWIEKAFTIDYFIKVIKNLIIAYTVCLLMQQAVRLIGVHVLPLINLMQDVNRGVLAGNSLAIEMSHSARILTVAYLALIRMYEIKGGQGSVKIKDLYSKTKWVTIGFMWSMLTMGSGTAFAGLAIISLYFIKRQYVFTIVPLLVASYFVIPYVEFEPLQRAKTTMDAALTMNVETVKDADYSAAARVVPLLNTINTIDFFSTNTWLGEGIDTAKNVEYLSESQKLGGIQDYGLLSYIFALVFILNCCIRRILSIETLIFIVLLAATVGNVAYVWGILFIFTTINYFANQNRIESDE